MAIKGKAKTRTRKAVTAGPKPVYVPVRKPLLARRGLWIAVLAVVAVGAAAGIWYGLSKERSQQRARDLARAERTAVSRYRAAIDVALTGVGQPIPPSGFQLVPDLQATIDGLEKGTAKGTDTGKTATDAAKAARSAYRAIDGVDVAALVRDKGFPFRLVNYLFNAKSKMVYGLKLYGQAALSIARAGEASGSEREDLLASAKGVIPIAQQVFSDGYSDYTEALIMTGLFTPTFQPPGVTPTGAPVGVPSP